MSQFSEPIENVECDFHASHPLSGYSVTVTPDEDSGGVFAEFRGPSVEGGSVTKQGSGDSLRSLNSSLNTARVAAIFFEKSGVNGFLKLFGDALAASNLDDFEAERKTKEGKGFK